jgi:pilus assembly protein Flp/PilA
LLRVFTSARISLQNRKLRLAKAGAWEGKISRSRETDMARVHRLIRDDSGATAIEDALIASLLAVFIIGALQLVGTQVSTVFTEDGGALK